jgi:hypothetical protein
LSRGRIGPADRLSVRRWLEQFHERELEVALEATTGWRSSSRSSGHWTRASISPSQPKPEPGEARRSAPRPTAWAPITRRGW